MTTRELWEGAHLKRASRALLATNFYFFTGRVMRQLFPGQMTTGNIHYLEAMCRAIQDVLEGRSSRLLVTLPPRHLKSTCAAVALPAFALGLFPTWEIMVISYGEDLLRVHSDQFRRIITSSWYQKLFPHVRIKKGQDRANEIVLTKGGRRKAVTARGGITGHGVDLAIMDDMMKADDIHSDTMREQVRQLYRETISSRHNNPQNVREIVLQQRLGVDDFAGYLIDTGTFRHFNLPLVAEDAQSFPLYNGREYTREPGDILNSDRMSIEEIENLLSTVGDTVYQTQYQQNPEVVGDNLVRFNDIAFCEDPPGRTLCAPVIQSWDPAFTDSPQSAFSVCTTWGRFNDKWYLLDRLRRHTDFVALQQCVVAQQKRWNADRVVIEKNGSGSSLVQQLKEDGYPWAIGTLTGANNKEVRLINQASRLISGEYVIPRNVPWFHELKREFMAFPNGNTDDQVDSVSQFVAWLHNNRGKAFMNTNPKTGRRMRGKRRSLRKR